MKGRIVRLIPILVLALAGSLAPSAFASEIVSDKNVRNPTLKVNGQGYALLQYTRDPIGDLEGGRYDALVAAALEDAGLKSS